MATKSSRERRVEPTSREQILAAARRVFAERGYHGGSMRRVAEAAGLKTPSHLYVYFRDKDDLYRQMVAESVGTVRNAMDAELALERAPVDALVGICTAYLGIFDDPESRMTFRIEKAEACARPGALDEAVRASGTPTLDLLQEYLGKEIAAGALRDVDPRATAVWLLWQLVSYIELREFYPIVFRDLPARDDYVRQLVHNVVYGLAPRHEGESA